jgi:hypothetical protein
MDLFLFRKQVYDMVLSPFFSKAKETETHKGEVPTKSHRTNGQQNSGHAFSFWLPSWKRVEGGRKDDKQAQSEVKMNHFLSKKVREKVMKC